MNQSIDTVRGEPSEQIGSMTPKPVRAVTALDRWLMGKLLDRFGDPQVDVRLWDGKPVRPTVKRGNEQIVILDRLTLWKLMFSPGYQFGEGYAHGRIEVTGDLAELCEKIYRGYPEYGWWDRFRSRTRLLGAHTLAGSRRNIHQHYDLGNDFYRLWLDEQMVYTCAYFPEPQLTLEQAQVAKMDHVCRKLRLQPGQVVFEAGCGWGALALHMAKNYGVRVKAWNVSHEQMTYAREQAIAQGLSDRVEFIEDDWRNIKGECDAFVSVGMLEHTGVKNYPLFGSVIASALRRNGLGLIHTIGKNVAEPLDGWIERRIFPGAEPPSLKQMADIFEGRRFSILDVENLRLHYARTLEMWLQRYETHVDDVRRKYGDEFVRIWRLYLAGSIAAFATGSLQLFQIVFAHPDNNELPFSRESLYADA